MKVNQINSFFTPKTSISTKAIHFGFSDPKGGIKTPAEDSFEKQDKPTKDDVVIEEVYPADSKCSHTDSEAKKYASKIF